jgi:excinuclease UvrABC helicase subunit UvrB
MTPTRDELTNPERFDYERLKSLEAKSIDDYNKFKGSKDEMERTVAWIPKDLYWWREMKKSAEPFKNIQEQRQRAAKAYDVEALNQYGEWAYQNFPDNTKEQS